MLRGCFLLSVRASSQVVELDLDLELDFNSIKNCGFDRIFQSILHTGIETQNLDWIFGFYATMDKGDKGEKPAQHRHVMRCG